MIWLQQLFAPLADHGKVQRVKIVSCVWRAGVKRRTEKRGARVKKCCLVYGELAIQRRKKEVEEGLRPLRRRVALK